MNIQIKLLACCIFISSFAFAATTEELSLSVGYHQTETITLKKIEAGRRKAYFIVRNFNNETATAKRIQAAEYQRRKQSLMKLKSTVFMARRVANVCPQFVEINVDKNPIRLCTAGLSLNEHKAISRWWKTGR